MRALLQENEDNVHYFHDNQVDTIVMIMMVSSTLSFIGALFVIINYFLIKSLRDQLSYKLILWIGVSDLMYAAGNLLGAPTDNFVCILQGMVTQFGNVASILWVVAVSWTIDYLTSVKTLPTKGKLRKILRYMHIIIWSLSALATIIPLFTNTYGPAGGWCWFKDDQLIDTVWRYVLFYFIVWLGIIYMLIIYIKAWIKIKKTNNLLKDIPNDSSRSSEGLNVGLSPSNDVEKSITTGRTNNISANVQEVEMTNIVGNSEKHKQSPDDTERQKQKKRVTALRRMILFPLILIICWLFGSIRRVVEFTGATVPFWLACVHIAMASLIGFFDALVYGLTKDVREKDKQYCQRKCACSEDQNE
eukprot:443299_1